jgi:hypothetical protein
MNFNLASNEIKVSSEALDKKGDPVYEFILNSETGIAKKIKRDPVTSHEKVVIEEVELNSV